MNRRMWGIDAPDDSVPNQPEQHIDQLKRALLSDVLDGCHIVPLVGAGLSAPAGILTGREFAGYLTYVVYKCLGPDDHPWNLREVGWPPEPTPNRIRTARCWFRAMERLVIQSSQEADCHLDEVSSWLGVREVQPDAQLSVQSSAKWLRRETPERIKPLTWLDSLKERPKVVPLELSEMPRLITELRTIKKKGSLLNEELVGSIRRLAGALRGFLSDLDRHSEQPLLESMCLCLDPSDPDEARIRLEWLLQIAQSSLVNSLWRTCVSREILRLAIGALGEWNTTLIFLARLNYRQGEFELTAPNPAVIDSFNSFITRNRQPSLSHRMLAFLSGPVRIRTIVSTNFDQLIEHAYAKRQVPLTSFSVSRTGGLPAHELVRAQDSLVKMHGGLFETRADYSVHEEPTEQDKENFFRYVFPIQHRVGGELHPREDEHDTRYPAPGRLLVLGYSASDLRVRELLRYLIGRIRRAQKRVRRIQEANNQADAPTSEDEVVASGKIYWVCHSQSDQKFINKLFVEYLTDYNQENKLPKILETAVTPRTDLFLYDLYQDQTRSLPSGGLSFRFEHNLPPRRADLLIKEPWVTQFCDMLLSAIDNEPFSSEKERFSSSAFKVERIVVNRQSAPSTSGSVAPAASGAELYQIIVHGGRGVSSIVAEVFERLSAQGKRRCVWLELSELAEPEDIVRQTLAAMAYTLGIARVEHFSLAEADLEGLVKYFRVKPGEWIVFLNGRDLPGIYAGLLHRIWPPMQTGSEHSFYHRLKEQRDRLARANILVVYLPFKVKSLAEAKWNERYRDRTASSNEWHQITKYGLEPAVCGDSSATIVKAILDWLDSEAADLVDKMRLLYSLSLIRGSCPTSALCTRATLVLRESDKGPSSYRYQVDRDNWRATKLERWIMELECRGVIRRKRGGFIRVNWDLGFWMRNYCEERGDDSFLETGIRRRGITARTHYWLGAWYLRAFLASDDPLPAFEALHHFFMCAATSSDALPPKPWTDLGQGSKKYQDFLQRSGIREMAKLLRLAQPKLRFWVEKARCLGEIKHGVLVLAGVVEWSPRSQFGQSFNDIPDEEVEEAIRTLGPDSRSLAYDLRTLLQEVQTTERILSDDAGETNYVHFGRSRRKRDFRSVGTSINVRSRELFRHLRDVLDEISKCICSQEETSSEEEQASRRMFDQHSETLIQGLRQKRVGTVQKWFALVNEAAIYDSSSGLLLFQAVVTLAQLLMRHAQFLEAGDDEPFLEQGNPLGQAGLATNGAALPFWRLTTEACAAGIEFSRLLPAEDVRAYCRGNVELRELYALALARLARASEAHRHLDEAAGYLSKSPSSNEPSEWAIWRLRRAEVLLVQSRQARRFQGRTLASEKGYPSYLPHDDPSDGEQSLSPLKLATSFSYLDDAWVCLEMAEGQMAMGNRSAWWWGRLYVLQLKVFAELKVHEEMTAPREISSVAEATKQTRRKYRRPPLAERLRIERTRHIERVLQRGLLLRPLDPWRTINLVSSAIRALGSAYRLSSSVNRALEYARTGLDDLLCDLEHEGDQDTNLIDGAPPTNRLRELREKIRTLQDELREGSENAHPISS